MTGITGPTGKWAVFGSNQFVMGRSWCGCGGFSALCCLMILYFFWVRVCSDECWSGIQGWFCVFRGYPGYILF